MNIFNAPADSSSTPRPIVWHWGWSATLAAIVLFTLAFRYALPVRDGDLWFHMLYGKYFLENKTLIADHTIFSWTPTTNDTIYVTWLPDIFLYLLLKYTGLPGIFAFRYLCVALQVVGCFFFARRLKVSTHPLTWLLCLLAVVMSYTTAFEKPENFSFVFMTLLAWNWWHIRSNGEEAWRSCYLFPLIMLVWVNSHGGFIFGAVFLALIAVGELLNTWLCPQNTLAPAVRKHLTIALLLAAITPFLTPYGYHYPLHLFRDLLPSQENINYNSKIAAYYSPFAFSDSYNFALCADLAVLILLLLYLRNLKKAEWSSLLANLVFAFLYTRFFRTTFYWVPILLFSGIHLLASTPMASSHWKHARLYYRFLPALLTATGFLVAGDTIYKSLSVPEKHLWVGFGISDGNPVAETQYIKKYFPDARIGNTYDQGAYLLWELWPENKVFMDARHFPYRAWSDEFFDFSRGNNVQEMTNKYHCDLWCIGLTNNRLWSQLLATGEWRLAFYGRNAAVLLHRDIPLPSKTPMASPDIMEMKNLGTAMDCLYFACSVKDWDTAEALFKVMQQRFTFKPQAAPMESSKNYYKGTRAYYNGNYQDAAHHLAQLQIPSDVSRFILVSCYHFLTEKAWQQKNDTLALAYAREAWDLAPENPDSLYNLGVIIWQLEKEKFQVGIDIEQTGEKTHNTQPDWRRFLVKFLDTAPHNTEFDAFRSIAQSLLEGRQQQRPSLLTPPKPVSRKPE